MAKTNDWRKIPLTDGDLDIPRGHNAERIHILAVYRRSGGLPPRVWMCSRAKLDDLEGLETPKIERPIEEIDWTGFPGAESLTVCVAGDDREREYPVNWRGTGSVVDHEQRYEGTTEIAVLGARVDGECERLVYRHPEHGWLSVGKATVRELDPDDGYDVMEDARLDQTV